MHVEWLRTIAHHHYDCQAGFDVLLKVSLVFLVTTDPAESQNYAPLSVSPVSQSLGSIGLLRACLDDPVAHIS